MAIDPLKQQIADQMKRKVRELINIDGHMLHHSPDVENLVTSFRVPTANGPRYFEVKLKEHW